MLKRAAHIIVSFWLSLLLLFGGTAKEFVHLFATHEDTVHHQHYDGELSFENEHHHCSFLSFSLTSFIRQEFTYPLLTSKELYNEYIVAPTVEMAEHSAFVPSLRGPPVA